MRRGSPTRSRFEIAPPSSGIAPLPRVERRIRVRARTTRTLRRGSNESLVPLCGWRSKTGGVIAASGHGPRRLAAFSRIFADPQRGIAVLRWWRAGSTRPRQISDPLLHFPKPQPTWIENANRSRRRLYPSHADLSRVAPSIPCAQVLLFGGQFRLVHRIIGSVQSNPTQLNRIPAPPLKT
jgi:hypothetical protein